MDLRTIAAARIGSNVRLSRGSGGRRDANRGLGGRPSVTVRYLLHRVLNDEALTRDLGDEEARLLMEWLAERTESIVERSTNPAEAESQVEALRRRGRAIRQFVHLWCYREDHGAATQLAGAERFRWPLPDLYADPWELMHTILEHESVATAGDDH